MRSHLRLTAIMLSMFMAATSSGRERAPDQHGPEVAQPDLSQKRALKDVFAEHFPDNDDLRSIAFEFTMASEESRVYYLFRFERLPGRVQKFADDVRTLKHIRTPMENDPLGIAHTDDDALPLIDTLLYYSIALQVMKFADEELFWDITHATIWYCTALLDDTVYFVNQFFALGMTTIMLDIIFTEMEHRHLRVIPPRVRDALLDLRRHEAVANFAVYLHGSLHAMCVVLEDPDAQLHEDYELFRTSFMINTGGPHTDTSALRNILHHFPPDTTPAFMDNKRSDALIEKIAPLLIQASGAYIYVRESYGVSKEVRDMIDDILRPR